MGANLPKYKASALRIADIYRKRWKIENMFQELEAYLHSEINTLGYPKAALFGFCVALVAYNVLAVVKAALRSTFGFDPIDNELSNYYLAGNITRTYDGMIIAIDSREWAIFQCMPLHQFAEFLLLLATNVKLSKYRKHQRGAKKIPPKREKNPNKPHVSTAKLLAAENS